MIGRTVRWVVHRDIGGVAMTTHRAATVWSGRTLLSNNHSCLANMLIDTSHRCFSSIQPSAAIADTDAYHLRRSNIHILYASQTGTAELFAMQLANAMGDAVVESSALSDMTPSDLRSDTLYVFLASTTGVGEPPDTARAFFKALQDGDGTTSLEHVQYSIFGLGNSLAHPNHFCSFAKDLDEALRGKKATSFMDITFGDDGGVSIEDDFDTWQEKFLDKLRDDSPSDDEGSSADAATDVKAVSPQPSAGVARPATSYPQIQLVEPEKGLSLSSANLLSRCPNFYMPNTLEHPIIDNKVIRQDIDNANNPSALRELQIQLPDGESYETGDHLVVYPQNNDAMVDAYLKIIENCPNPHSIVTTNDTNYPHPTNISLYDTLRHCVDLSAVPSPSFARFLTNGSTPLDYKTDICQARLTPLEVLSMANGPPKISATDLLYQLPKLAPRYYSIASSSLRHPKTVYLTYRPVQYVNTKGSLKEGLCTSFFSRHPKSLIAGIRSNPSFRLPKTNVPILLIAGGCGVAPIRAFLEELVYLKETGSDAGRPPHVHLYLGFRDPNDQVYQDLVEDQAKDLLASHYITFTSNCVRCSLVSDAILDHSAEIYSLLTEQNASVFICGGARTFGVAIQNAVQQILEGHGAMDAKQSTAFLQTLIRSGRFHEDLSD